MEKKMNILISSGFIDFYINAKKFESYKTEKGMRNYVLSCLEKIFDSLTGKQVNTLTIRDVSITSNNFWGENFVEINDLGYSASNKVKKNDKYLTLRLFNIDVISVFEKIGELKEFFPQIKGKDFIISCSTSKVV